MNRVRECIGSSSGLAPMRQGLGLGWIISALSGIAVLLGASEAAESDRCEYRTYDDCGYDAWCASWNEDTPIRCRTTYVDCSFEYHCTSRSEAEQATPTAVLTPAAAQPAQHRLGDSYPNPFNPAVVIPLDLATDQKQVHLALYDVLGRRVRQLWDGSLRAGRHRFVWDGRDAAGKGVAAGVYIYKVEVDGRVEAKKTTKLP